MIARQETCNIDNWVENQTKETMATSATRSLVDIKAARETRTSEALKIKDEQIRILTEQNNKLLEAIEKGEEEISAIQLEKLHIDEENRQLRESIFTVQSKAKVEAGELETLRSETDERERQFKTISAQHTEILKLLEGEEAKCSRLTSDLDSCQSELRDLKVKHTSVVNDAKATTEDLEKSTKTCQLQSEEIRLLRTEVETVKNKKHEEAMKSSVEIESLQEQLRVRKEKQYQLLEKLQSQEESRRRAEDQVSSLEDKVNSLHSKSSSAETQLQLEISSKLSQADLNKKLTGDNEILVSKNKDVTSKLQEMEQKQVKMDAEARTNGEQLREMAEKVFQLLERLKLAELGKTRSMEALRNKEDEVHSLKKKLANLVKEHTKEAKARAQIQSERKALEDQIKDLKKHNQQLGLRCKEEARLKVRFDDERKDAEAKIRTLNSRISFLLNKLQTDEEAKSAQKEEMQKLQSRAETLHDTNCSLQNQLNEATSNMKTMGEDLREKEQKAEATRIKLEALQQLYDEQDELREETKNREMLMKGGGDNPLLAGGRLRFFVEKKTSLGLFALKAKCAKDRHWLDENNCNMFMKKMSKSPNKQDLLINKIAEIYGIILTREEEIEKLSSDTEEQNAEIEKLSRKLSLIHDRLSVEEESKRRTLLKYINAVKASVSLGEDGCEKTREEVGSIGAGIIRLPEACLTDEEVHAISAMLRENQTIVELNLRGNMITDEGCRALASVLSAPSSLENIDLRSNRITRKGIKLIVEALDRSSRVRHVYVHTGGKIEAFGKQEGENNSDGTNSSKRKNVVCVVDIRDNSKPEDSKIFKEEMFGLPITVEDKESNKCSSKPNKKYSDEERREKKQKLKSKKTDKR